MLKSGSIQGGEATAKHRSHAPYARVHLEAAVQCPALSATVEVAHIIRCFPYGLKGEVQGINCRP